MNARELIQELKSQLTMKAELEEANVRIDVIGTSREAKAQIFFIVEGKQKQIELTAKEVPLDR